MEFSGWSLLVIFLDITGDVKSSKQKSKRKTGGGMNVRY